MNKKVTINNEERRLWIENDEGLYNWKRSSKLSMREFIRQNRVAIDEVIFSVTTGKQPAHYLAYGGRNESRYR
jgi:hypothetical protein